MQYPGRLSSRFAATQHTALSKLDDWQCPFFILSNDGDYLVICEYNKNNYLSTLELHSPNGLNNWERNHILSLLRWLYNSTKNHCFIVLGVFAKLI